MERKRICKGLCFHTGSGVSTGCSLPGGSEYPIGIVAIKLSSDESLVAGGGAGEDAPNHTMLSTDFLILTRNRTVSL